MAKKMTREQLDLVVSSFARQATRKWDGHAYTAGYLQSLVVSLLTSLPAKEQQKHVTTLLSSSVWE